jgi:hypothetical protein
MSYSEPPPIRRFVRMVAGTHRHRERGVEELRIPDPPAPHEIDDLQVDLLEVQPVGNHQLDATAPARPDHPPALVHGDRHRLLAEHVDAGVRGPDGVLGVLGIRQRDVDRVHLLEARLVLVVRVRAVDPVLARELAQLRWIAADQRSDARIAPRVPEGRQHGHLGDVAEADHRVANRTSRRHRIGRR